MPRVEAFATGIKIESSDQSPFLEADQGIKVASKLLKSTDQEWAAAIWPLILKNQAIKSLRREWSSDQAHFLLIKHFDRGYKRFNRWRICDYPLLAKPMNVIEFYSQSLPSCMALTRLKTIISQDSSFYFTMVLHVRLEDHPVAEMGSKDVTVEMIMCAVNPSDINQIQGDQYN